MSRKAKILIILSLVLLALAAYLIFSSLSVKTLGASAPQAKNENTVLPDESYELKLKEIIAAYEKFDSDNSFTMEKIAKLKNELLDVRGLPAKYQELHLNFVLALDKMNNYLTVNQEQDKSASRQIIRQLQADYGWLND